MRSESRHIGWNPMTRPFDAVLFDVGGVLMFPDPAVLVPTLAYYGASRDHDLYFRAHYSAMAVKSANGSPEHDWSDFNAAFVEAVGVPEENRSEAAYVLARVRNAHIWRAPIAGSRDGLAELNRLGVPIGIVSNASGQVETVLQRSGLCQVGDGEHPSVLCVVDSDIVRIAKPDPAIFEFALPHFDGIERSRIAYVGDNVTMDVRGSTAAGLTPVLFDPFDDAAHLFDGMRIRSLADVVAMFTD